MGAALVGVHMAMTHGICLSMISAYIPAGEIPGLGRVSGTVWSFTDFVLGKVCHWGHVAPKSPALAPTALHRHDIESNIIACWTLSSACCFECVHDCCSTGCQPSTSVHGCLSMAALRSLLHRHAGVVLAYSNSLAGKLTDLSLKAGYGNTGCFYGGAAATVLSGLVLLFAAKFLDLGREDLLIAKKG